MKVGDEAGLALKVSNPGQGEVMTGLHWKMLTEAGSVVADKEEAIHLGSNEDATIKLGTPPAFGLYTIVVTPTNLASGTAAPEKKMRFAYMMPAGPSAGLTALGDFMFGVCGHPQGQSREDQKLEAMAAAWCGAKALREDIAWARMEPNDGVWNFAPFDFVVDNYAKWNIEILPIYSYTPKWAVAKGWSPLNPKSRPSGPPDMDYWRVFVRKFAEHYRDKVRFVEVWNEPDLYSFANFPLEDYIKMLGIAYDEVKQAAPEWRVFSGGVTGLPHPGSKATNPEMVPAIIRSGKYDIFAFHAHGLFSPYKNQVDRLPSFGNTKPWYSNETAVSSVVYGEEVQAETLFEKLIYAWTHGAVGYNWYDLRNDGFDPQNNEHNFGLITKDFYPKPAYVAYNALALLYSGARFVHELPLPEHPAAYGWLFKRKTGDYLIPNWTEGVTDQLVVVSNIKGKASLIDLYGNETPLATEGDSVILPVASRPSTLRIVGQNDEPVVTGALMALDGEVVAGSNGANKFHLKVSNPTAGPIPVSIVMTAPAGMRVMPSSQSVVLKPGETAAPEFELISDKPVSEATDDNLGVDIAFGTLLRKHLHYKIKQSVVLPAEGLSPQPVFVLNDASQVTSVVMNAPENSHLFWKGPDDLSAKVWLGKTRDSLLARILVKDDVHCEPFSGDGLWQGDSIHFMLDLGQRWIWDIGLAHHADMGPEVYVWVAPALFSREQVASQIQLETKRDEAQKTTLYELRIPFFAIGMNQVIATHGFGFHIQINDNDGSGRKDFISIVPGEEQFRKAEYFPVIRFAEK